MQHHERQEKAAGASRFQVLVPVLACTVYAEMSASAGLTPRVRLLVEAAERLGYGSAPGEREQRALRRTP